MIKRIYLSESDSTLSKEVACQINGNPELKLLESFVPRGTAWEQYAETVKFMREQRPDYIVTMTGHSPFEIENLALASQLIGARAIYVSSPEVFDGQKAVFVESSFVELDGSKKVVGTYVPYDEYDFPRPSTLYGLNALHGEQYIQRYVSRYAILRPGYLFDAEDLKSANVKELIPVGDPLVSPTRIVDFAKLILEVIDKRICGVYHIVNKAVPITLSELIMQYKPFIFRKVEPKQGQQYCHNQMITGHKFTDRTGFVMPELTWKQKTNMRIVN
jgi:hypothetical protein